MNLNSKKLTIPDLISVGVFTAIYFVLVTMHFMKKESYQPTLSLKMWSVHIFPI